jgi:C-terminal processing protease CtpA/Prc
MNKLKFAAILAAGATLALSPAQVAAQAAAKPISFGAKLQPHADGPEVAALLPDRTAVAAGLKVGDILLEVGGKPISPEVLMAYMKQLKEGDQVSFKVKRAGAVLDLTGKAIPMPEGAPAPQAPAPQLKQ